MAKSRFYNDGNFWKFLLWLIGIGATALVGYANLTTKVDTLDKGYTELKNNLKQNDTSDDATKGDVRDLKKDVTYIRESVDRIDKKLQGW